LRDKKVVGVFVRFRAIAMPIIINLDTRHTKKWDQ
jgi:hypothetical protein